MRHLVGWARSPPYTGVRVEIGVMNELQAITAIMHDAEVVLLETNRTDKSAKLGLVTDRLETWYFDFDDVALIRAVDFVGQNVVSRLLIYSIWTFSGSDIDHWVNWVSSFTDVVNPIKSPEVLNS